MKLGKTCQVSFCQNSPLKIRGARGVIEITPLYPPYFKGEIEGETPCVLEGDIEGVTRNRSSL